MSGKFALIIGNTEYTDSGLAQLTAPGKDTEDFARMLKDHDIGAFDEVNILLNQPEPVVRGAIDEFFDLKKPDDLLVLYFSGHGVRDELGALYLAVKNTNRARLRSTAVKSDYIREAMDQSRSRRQVLILDCCNSGAYAQGTKAATGVSIGTASAFEAGYGRIILTASDSTQFAWEGDKVIGETDNSLFTHFLIEGLEGGADLDGDGRITVDELYDYTYEKVKLVTPKQTPSKFSSKQQGEIVLRQFTRIDDIKAVALPDDLISEIEDLRPAVREWAVQRLEKILKGKNIGLARSAREALEKIAIDDNTTRRVSQMATQLLESIRQAEQAEEERKAREEAERIAAQIAEEERIALEKAEAERKAKEEAELLLAKQKSEEERKAKKEAKRVAALKAKEVQKAREGAERTAIQKAEQERLTREKAEFERKAKDEAERLAAQKSEEERLVREQVEAERKAKEEAEKLARAKAEREAAEREAVKKAEREAIELAARKKAEKEAKEKVAGKEGKAIRPLWLKFGAIGTVIIALGVCGYGATSLLSGMFGGFFAAPTLTPSSAPFVQLATEAPPIPSTEAPTLIPTPLGGGNGQIAFASNRDEPNPDTCDNNCNYEIYVMNADGSEQTRLTNNAAADYEPAWPPDGKRVAFVSNRDETNPDTCDNNCNFEIYVMNADGSEQTRLTNNAAADYGPAWSPDGKHIAFSSYRDDNSEIYVMNVDGSEQIRLTNSAATDFGPAWSPDGKHIAFYSISVGKFEIYVMNADGSEQTRLTNNAADDYEPAWSPDGKHIAFESNRDDNSEIYVMNVDGSAQTRLTNNPADDYAPAWSPDGDHIAFESNRDDNSDIYVMNADGSAQTRLTNNEVNDSGAAWQPALTLSPQASNFYMATDEAGTNRTTVFSPTDDVFVHFDIAGIEVGTPVQSRWYALDIEGEDPNTPFQTIDYAYEEGIGNIYFQLTNADGWPIGNYKVEIYMNGTKVGEQLFSVQ